MDTISPVQARVAVEEENDKRSTYQPSTRQTFWNTVLSREPYTPARNIGITMGERVVGTRAEMDISTLCRSSTSHHPFAPASAVGSSFAPAVVKKSKKLRYGKTRKPTACPKCPQTFKRTYDLHQHINAVHLKIKTFECAQCSRSFAHKGTLSKHHKTVHLKLRPFTCVHCGDRFSEKGNVNKHILRSIKCRQAHEMAMSKTLP